MGRGIYTREKAVWGSSEYPSKFQESIAASARLQALPGGIQRSSWTCEAATGNRAEDHRQIQHSATVERTR